MKFIKTYKFPISITVAFVTVFFIFQNGTCTGTTSQTTSTINGGSTSIVTATPTPVPTSAGLAITTYTSTLNTGGSFQFAATGGAAPYTFSILSGLGSITSAGLFTASTTTAGSTQIAVTDYIGNRAYKTVTVSVGTLTLSAASDTVALNSQTTLTATGGYPPYYFSIYSGGGSLSAYSVNANTRVYVAPNATTSAVVRVSDNAGYTATKTLTVSNSTSASSTTAKFISASTNSPLSGWDVSKVLDANTSTCYSSSSYGGNVAPSNPPYVTLTLGTLTGAASSFAVDHLYIAARKVNGTVLSFPIQYYLKAHKVDGSGWVTVGSYSNQPDSDGVLRLHFSAVTADQLQIQAVYLGVDDYYTHYMQFCDAYF